MGRARSLWRRLLPSARAGAVIVALLALSVALAPHVDDTATPGGLRLPWWTLALMFAVVEVVVLHAQVRRQAQVLSLCELPLVLGLFFAAPDDLVLARVLGPLLVLLLHRRRPVLTLLFTTALSTATATVAVAVFHAVHGPDLSPVGSAWLATWAAVVAAAVLNAVATTVAAGVGEGWISWSGIARATAQEVPRAVGVGTVGLAAVYALAFDPVAAVPVAASAGFVLVGFRAYAVLTDRHLALERVYRFTQTVSTDREVDEVLRSVLVEAGELLQADVVEVVVAPSGWSGGALRVTLSVAGGLERREIDELEDLADLWCQMTTQDGSVLLPRRSRDAGTRRTLQGMRRKDAVAAPLRISSEVIGMVVVADRMGEARTFQSADVRLLETITNHAGVALQNSRLIGRLRHEALHDALTGLPNRVCLQREITAAAAVLRTGRGRGMAVMLMDLDRFKEVNDTLGHHHGDQLLKEVAQRLTADVQDMLVARLGGDEFAAVVASADSAEVGLEGARQLVAALQRPFDVDGVTVTVGGSVGVAWTSSSDCRPADLLKRADLAMYAAKANGGGVVLFDPGMDTSSPERLALIGELRSAIELGELEVHVQPKARLDTGRVTSVEALVRWSHPARGLIPPDEFIPVAERSGLIGPLTTYVLHQAVAACASWSDQGFEVNVAVNLSARSLIDLDLTEHVRSILAAHGVPARLLTLEITEGSVMSDPDRTLRVLTELRDMGVRLSVDDFGTGYSSLSYLKRLPVHEVKIDRSFVTDMVSNPEDTSIVRSIIDLGGNLSLEVVAEGVEDHASWASLEAMGCTYVQGYHLSRALAVPAFLPWLAEYELVRLRLGPLQAVAAG